MRALLTIAMLVASGISSRAEDIALPPDAPDALAALNASPRHAEWLKIEVPGLKAPLATWVVYPERSDKAPVVVLIAGTEGLSDWVRAAVDNLAKAGFIALAPDLVSGTAPEGLQQIDAVRTHAVALPSSNGKSATFGFGRGGERSFAYATVQSKLDAAVVFYGPAPELTALGMIRAPVLGLYLADDERSSATLRATQNEMHRLGKTYEFHEYEGAGHAFLSRQSEHGGANRRATEKSWPRAIEFLRRHLGERSRAPNGAAGLGARSSPLSDRSSANPYISQEIGSLPTWSGRILSVSVHPMISR